MKLVADALEEDHHATCEELSRGTGTKTSQKNAQEQTSVVSGWALILHVVTKKLRDYG